MIIGMSVGDTKVGKGITLLYMGTTGITIKWSSNGPADAA